MPCFDQSSQQLSERDLAARDYIRALQNIENLKIDDKSHAAIISTTKEISKVQAIFNFTEKELARAEVYVQEESERKERDRIQRRREQKHKERYLLPAKWQKADLRYMPIKDL
jgi:hypothetical protein